MFFARTLPQGEFLTTASVTSSSTTTHNEPDWKPKKITIDDSLSYSLHILGKECSSAWLTALPPRFTDLDLKLYLSRLDSRYICSYSYAESAREGCVYLWK
ncbi:hypothetical protein BV898_14090 [Hypsibius exemplaris]|uniref:Uncharacterized protein n=1 Tax=Hypsibius exemplaris TaxID=2072580 RepID=A0A1W0W8Q9_HYPEX|nr:hypothetical protein BV898_14090 [Hypsibius exemplaris]